MIKTAFMNPARRHLSLSLPLLPIRCFASRGRIDATEKRGYAPESTAGARMMKKNIRGSVFKLNLLAKQITGKPVQDALTQMKFSKKRRAQTVANAIKTACNMADVYHGLAPEELYIAEAITGRGSYSRRPHYRARGKFDFIRKTQSHLTIVVKEDNRDMSTKRRGLNPRRNKNRRKPGES
jgi:large subunit ribosomal protein L22